MFIQRTSRLFILISKKKSQTIYNIDYVFPSKAIISKSNSKKVTR